MNHWFLVSRDIMWAVLALSPLCMSFLEGRFSIEGEPGTPYPFMFFAVLTQVFGIVALYTGWIK